MKERRICCVILFVILILFDVKLTGILQEQKNGQMEFDPEVYHTTFRNQQVDPLIYHNFLDYDTKKYSVSEYIAAYFYQGEQSKTALTARIDQFRLQYPKEWNCYVSYEDAIWADVRYFPVAASMNHPDATVAFDDSWMQSRTFGGNRGHEGCDIMASVNTRGYYPIVSVSDGVIEKIGWLPQGGYRLGIRSPHGAYFYYAHLYDYVRDFVPGEPVTAGEIIGFMGDSGYSKVEGTVGNFDVHLHFGIYLNDENGKEFSVNSYSVLKMLEKKKYRCMF